MSLWVTHSSNIRSGTLLQSTFPRDSIPKNLLTQEKKYWLAKFDDYGKTCLLLDAWMNLNPLIYRAWPTILPVIICRIFLTFFLSAYSKWRILNSAENPLHQLHDHDAIFNTMISISILKLVCVYQYMLVEKWWHMRKQIPSIKIWFIHFSSSHSPSDSGLSHQLPAMPQWPSFYHGYRCRFSWHDMMCCVTLWYTVLQFVILQCYYMPCYVLCWAELWWNPYWCRSE